MEQITFKSLHEQVKHTILTHAAQNDTYHLMTEEDLAKTLGVSRITVREAMNSLVRDKLLLKRKRNGNFLLKSVIDTKLRLDLHGDFSLMIEELGMHPTLKTEVLGFLPTSQLFAKYCPQFANEPQTYHIAWTYYADDIPTIQCYYEMPQSLIQSEDCPHTAVGTDEIHNHNASYDLAKQDITHYITKVRAKNAPSTNEIFGIDRSIPLLCFEQTSYNIQDIPFGFTDIYFNPEIMDLSYVMMYRADYRTVAPVNPTIKP